MNTDTMPAKPRTRAAKTATAATTAPTPTVATKPASLTMSASLTKSDTVIKLLLRVKGATAMELIAATDWQAHSVRAFLSGLRKKGRLIVRGPRKSGEAAYHIVAVESGDDSGPASETTPPASELSGGAVTAGLVHGQGATDGDAGADAAASGNASTEA